jgi:hypothetical protein
MDYRRCFLVSTGSVLLVTALLLLPVVGFGQGAGPMPALRFDPPAGFIRSGGDLFVPNSSHRASIKVYYFRPFSGQLQNEVNASLMRDWQKEINRPVQYLTPPQHESRQVPGADEAVLSAFTENYFGKSAINLRLVVVSSQAIGVVYLWAEQDAWQYYNASLNNFLRSVRVEAGDRAPAADASPQQNAARRAMAGLYLGQWMTSTRFYLFSEDGRFYRGHRLPSAPGGVLARFDYQRAREVDPDNAGTYRISGNELIIEVAGQNPVRVPVPVNGQVKIEAINYKRQVLSR